MASAKWWKPKGCSAPMSWPSASARPSGVHTTSIYPLPKMSLDYVLDKPKFTERLNAPVQGTAADILKTAMANLGEGREEYPNALQILTVHDEIVIECGRKEAEKVARW